MKDLINKIKYNRLPDEVLLILSYLNDESKFNLHPLLENEIRLIDKNDKSLFVIDTKKKLLLYYEFNIMELIHSVYTGRLYKTGMGYKFIELAIKNSIYSTYRLI